MKKLMVPFLVLLLMVSFIPSPVARGRIDETIATITEDGDIREKSGSYLRDNTDGEIYVGAIIGDPDYYRGYIEFDISSIPDGAVIDSVILWYQLEVTVTHTQKITEMVVQPSVGTDANVWADADNGDTYATAWGTGTINTWLSKSLGAAAAADLQANLGVDWFAIGFTSASTSTNPQIHSSEESGREPYLVVKWHLATDYAFTVENPVYENNTDAGTVSVHVTGDGFDEDHDISAETTLYFPVMPTAFSWDIGGGFSRTIYVTDEENFTVTLPEATTYVYGFIIKDYTGKIGEGDAYLEAWRTIGGVETLVTRMPIQQPNPVPMNLVYGRTYNMKILYTDGSRLTWGYFVAGGSFSPTILIRGIEFDQTAYLVNTFLSVQAQRVNETLITVDYLDERNETLWANVTIRIRNGAVVSTYNSNSSGYTWNYAGAVSGTNYLVTVQGLHVKAGAWGYSIIFDAEAVFPTLPTLTGIFTLGGLDVAELIGYIIALMGYLGFSYRWKGPGVMAGLGTLALVRFIGLITMNYYLLAAIGFLSIAVALLAGGET